MHIAHPLNLINVEEKEVLRQMPLFWRTEAKTCIQFPSKTVGK